MALVLLTTLRESLNAVGLTTISISDSAMSNFEFMASSRVESEIDRKLAVATDTDYFDIAEYQDTLWLSRFPVVSILGLTESTTLIGTGDYLVYSDSGMIKLADRIVEARGAATPFFAMGKRTVACTYSAGYTTIPGDIQQIVTNMVGRTIGGSGVSALSGESIGDYTYSRSMADQGSTGGFTTDDLAILERYRPKLFMENW